MTVPYQQLFEAARSLNAMLRENGALYEVGIEANTVDNRVLNVELMPIPSQPTEPEPIPSAFYKVVARLYHVEYDTDVYLFAMFRKDKDTGLRHFVPVEQFWGRPMLSLPSVVEAFAPISPNVWGIIPISELDSVKIYESALGEVQDNHVH